MNNKGDWWKYLVLAVVVIGLIWWRQQGKEGANDEQELAEQLQLEQQVDKFLEEKGVELPVGSDRANLKSVGMVVGTGVVSRVEKDGRQEFTVMADLEELTGGWYEGWLVKGDEYLSMGKLLNSKGGYVLDYTGKQDLSDYNGVKVSRETKLTAAPTAVVLEGEFK